MARATHLLHWMLTGCVASCFLSWLAAQLPQHLTAIISINVLILFFWGLSWVLDDGIIKLTRIDPLTYYTSIILWGASHFVGLGIYLWIYHANSLP